MAQVGNLGETFRKELFWWGFSVMVFEGFSVTVFGKAKAPFHFPAKEGWFSTAALYVKQRLLGTTG